MRIALFLMLAFAACQPTPTPEEQLPDAIITTSPTEIFLSSEAATTQLAIESDSDWGISSSEEWCKVSPSGGIAGSSTVKITVTENKGEAVRNALLTIKSGQTNIGVPLRQNYKVDAVEVEDENFMAALIKGYDVDSDGVLSSVEATAITSLEVASSGITSLAGIEKLGPISSIDCSDNQIENIDLSAVPRLVRLNCKNNRLKELDIQFNTSLVELNCLDNPLEKIYVWTGFKTPDGYQVPEGVKFVEPEIPTPAGYELVWQDEFNSAGRSLPDNSKWWYETGGGGWGNNEKQTYVSGREGTDTVALVSDGTLKITAKKVGSKVLSVRMNTNASWTYGYFEASLKLPVGKGTWPAFWMMPKNFTRWPGDGEIDIMEHVGYHPNYVSSSIHCQAYYHSIGTQKTHEIYLATAQKEFHTYACEWTEDYIKFYFDGDLHFTFHNDHKNNYDTWPFYNPFYLKLNLAWGGNWGGAMGLDESCLPATYEIDYVRVFKRVGE